MKYCNKKIGIKELGENIDFVIPRECPMCHDSIYPIYESYKVKQFENGEKYIMLFFNCPACQTPFCAQYNVDEIQYNVDEIKRGIISINAPSTFIACNAKLAPYLPAVPEPPENLKSDNFKKFQEAYRDACAAEAFGLTNIAGMAYRKALECLAKDYWIYKLPEQRESIEKENLSVTIARFTDDDIKTLAKCANWIANDAVHYAQKHPERDLEDIKKFFKLVLADIDKCLILDDARSIEKR